MINWLLILPLSQQTPGLLDRASLEGFDLNEQGLDCAAVREGEDARGLCEGGGGRADGAPVVSGGGRMGKGREGEKRGEDSSVTKWRKTFYRFGTTRIHIL